MESGNLKVKVLEGKVNNVNIVQVDADGVPTGKKGNVPPHIIMREVPFKVSAPCAALPCWLSACALLGQLE